MRLSFIRSCIEMVLVYRSIIKVAGGDADYSSLLRLASPPTARPVTKFHLFTDSLLIRKRIFAAGRWRHQPGGVTAHHQISNLKELYSK